jgi:uncharacterized membrane protein
MTTMLATLSAIAVGLTSGLYWGFAVGVMPGLRDADDRAFVAVMQAINRRILTPGFLVVFLGSLLLPIATALALLLDDGQDGARRWGIAGAIAAAVPFAITAGGNVPLNDALDRAGLDDPAAARRAFERPWTRRNAWRATASTVALAALVGTTLAMR